MEAVELLATRVSSFQPPSGNNKPLPPRRRELEQSGRTNGSLLNVLSHRVAVARAHFGQGLVSARGRNYEKARAEFEEAARLDPDEPKFHYQLSQACARLGDTARARRELELYRPELAAKPEVLALSKSELTGSEEVRQRLAKELGRDVLAISAVTGAGLAELVRNVVERLSAIRAEEATEPPPIIIPPHRRMQNPEAEEEVLT